MHEDSTMFKQSILVTALVCGLVPVSYASADTLINNGDRGIYAGAQVGKSIMNYGGTDYLLARNSVDDRPWGGRAYAGYAFNDLLAAELGYGYYGKAEFKDNYTGNKQDMLQQGIDLAGRVNIPLDFGFGFYAKAGAMLVMRDSVESRSNFFVGKGSNSKLVPLAGLGVSYNFSPCWSMDLSWTGTLSNGDLPSMYFYGLGLTYKFQGKGGAY